MSSSKALFIKAQKYFNKGEINKSLNYCEKAISQDIKNVAALNFKGFLHYYLGDINTAKALWETNKELNNDKAAKSYLLNLSNEEELLKTYITANNFIQDYEIKEAVELLEKCNKSSFNTINVNCSLAKCYIHLGMIEEAQKTLDRVFFLDRDNEFGKEINKSLIDLGYKKASKKSIYIGMLIVLVLIIAFSLAMVNTYYERLKGTNGSLSNENSHAIKNSTEKSQDTISDEVVNKEEFNVVKKEDIFPIADFKDGINNKNYDKLYDLNEVWKNKDINIRTDEEKALLGKCNEMLIQEGVSQFYEQGRDCVDKNNNGKAIELLNKALIYANDSYLKESIIYFLSSAYNNNGDIENAIKISEEYHNLYDNGAYSQQVIYNLVLLYKNKDNGKAKEYANELMKKYKKSKYNNDIVKQAANS